MPLTKVVFACRVGLPEPTQGITSTGKLCSIVAKIEKKKKALKVTPLWTLFFPESYPEFVTYLPISNVSHT